MAKDLRISTESARKMWERDSIAPGHFPDLIKSAKRKGVELSFEDLFKLSK